MKRILAFVAFFQAIVVLAHSQPLTSITQLKDVKKEAAYYTDLQYLVEDIGVTVSQDFYFYPNQACTKVYWATLTNQIFDNVAEYISTSSMAIKNENKRDVVNTEMMLVFPSGYCNLENVVITSTSQLKDIQDTANYFPDVQGLIERYGLVWATTATTFTPYATITRPAFEAFFAGAFKATIPKKGTGLLAHADFIIYMAAWTRNVRDYITKKVEEAKK
ncbi:MAG: hypothetical protein ABIX01_15960 [Chitinophagaceae bacterium]